jgi:hypothetical protein
VAVALFPLLVLWTLPQTLGGLGFAAVGRLHGHRGAWYRFGPFLFYVMPWAPRWLRGISLGAVVLADDPGVLTHEFCHVYTALWLSWLYLPVYGIEYGTVGHARSPHERLTRHFERHTGLGWRRIDATD